MDIAPDTVEMRLTRLVHRLVPGLMSSDKQTPPAAAMPPPPATGISLGLTRIHRLLAALRSPHHATPVVHIAGTNGKGSVSAYLASILQHGGGIATARFNSPHLVDEWDCIHLHGRPVDEHTFRAAKQKVQLASERENVDATSFEVLTATAFTLFATATPPVDLAVVEVGMGGAQDATNVVPASRTLLSVITALDLDHQKFLGDTVSDIARVKAGIIREEGDVVVSVQAHEAAREAIEQVAHERHARVWQAGRASLVPESTPASTSTLTSTGLPPAPLVSIPLGPASSSTEAFESPSPSLSLHARLPLPGSYQLENAATAVLCASLLRSLPRTRQFVPALGDGGGSSSTLTDAAIRTGVEATRWPGRLSWLSLPRSEISSSASATAPTRSDSDSDSDSDNRLLLLDGAHNPSSALLLASYLSTLPPHLLPSTLIFALSAPRDPSDVVRPLLQALLGGGGVGTAATTTADTERKPTRRRRRTVRVVCCGFSTPVGMDWVRPTSPSELADRVRQEVDRLGLLPRKERGGVEVQVLEARDAEEALRIAEAAEEEEQEEEVQDSVEEDNGGGVATTRRRPPPPPPIVVAGSLYLVADVMRLARRLGAGAGADGQEP